MQGHGGVNSPRLTIKSSLAPLIYAGLHQDPEETGAGAVKTAQRCGGGASPSWVAGLAHVWLHALEVPVTRAPLRGHRRPTWIPPTLRERPKAALPKSASVHATAAVFIRYPAMTSG